MKPNCCVLSGCGRNREEKALMIAENGWWAIFFKMGKLAAEELPSRVART
jgi:hypothetical protein